MHYRFTVLVAILATMLSLSGCVALTYGGPGYTERVPKSVPLNDNTYEILKHYDRPVEIMLDNGELVELSHTFVLDSKVCGDVGCIHSERIRSVIITDERFDAENAIFETAATIQAAALWAVASPFISSNNTRTLAERMNADPRAFLTKTAQEASRYENTYTHPVCGSGRFTPEVEYAPEFLGDTDEEAAQWLWENRFDVPVICLRRSGILYRHHLMPEQQVELHHTHLIRQYWGRARCERAIFDTSRAQGFATVKRIHPAWAVITARQHGMSAEEAWVRFQSILSQDKWVDDRTEGLERACKDAGGVADTKNWPPRLTEVRKLSIQLGAENVAFVGSRRETTEGQCKDLEHEDRGSCYLQFFASTD